MNSDDKTEFFELFNEAVKPFHGALGENQKAITDHAIEAATNNRLMFDQLKSIDEKMDKQTMQIGVVSGRMESLANQNADQYKQLGVLNAAMEIENGTPEKLAKHQPPRLLAGFMNNTTVQVILAIAVLAICYGLFSMVGVDITKAKKLVSPTISEPSNDID